MKNILNKLFVQFFRYTPSIYYTLKFSLARHTDIQTDMVISIPCNPLRGRGNKDRWNYSIKTIICILQKWNKNKSYIIINMLLRVRYCQLMCDIVSSMFNVHVQTDIRKKQIPSANDYVGQNLGGITIWV